MKINKRDAFDLVFKYGISIDYDFNDEYFWKQMIYQYTTLFDDEFTKRYGKYCNPYLLSLFNNCSLEFISKNLHLFDCVALVNSNQASTPEIRKKYFKDKRNVNFEKKKDLEFFAEKCVSLCPSTIIIPKRVSNKIRSDRKRVEEFLLLYFTDVFKHNASLSNYLIPNKCTFQFYCNEEPLNSYYNNEYCMFNFSLKFDGEKENIINISPMNDEVYIIMKSELPKIFSEDYYFLSRTMSSVNFLNTYTLFDDKIINKATVENIIITEFNNIDWRKL